VQSITKTVVLANGDKIEFPRLTCEDLFAVCDSIRADREAKAKQLAKEMSINNYELYNVLLDIRHTRPLLADLLVSVKSPEGAVEVVRRSLNKSTVEKAKHKDVLAQLPIPEVIVLAGDLVMDVQDPEEPQAEEKESPLPVAPSTGA
jgi:hypothetical protein